MRRATLKSFGLIWLAGLICTSTTLVVSSGLFGVDWFNVADVSLSLLIFAALVNLLRYGLVAIFCLCIGQPKKAVSFLGSGTLYLLLPYAAVIPVWGLQLCNRRWRFFHSRRLSRPDLQGRRIGQWLAPSCTRSQRCTFRCCRGRSQALQPCASAWGLAATYVDMQTQIYGGAEARKTNVHALQKLAASAANDKSYQRAA